MRPSRLTLEAPLSMTSASLALVARRILLLPEALTSSLSNEPEMRKLQAPLQAQPRELLRKKMDNFEKFDRFLMRLSDNTYRMPTLVKKYMKVNARIIAFNVDPLFNYSLDGLIILRIKDYPRAEILSMTKDVDNINDREAIMNRFGYSLKD